MDKKYGLLLGYALRIGDCQTGAEGEESRYTRFHYLAAGAIFKTTYWWKKHLGLLMSVSAIGGVSFYSYYTYPENDSHSCCLLPEKDAFDFADTGFWELGFHIGLEI